MSYCTGERDALIGLLRHVGWPKPILLRPFPGGPARIGRDVENDVVWMCLIACKEGSGASDPCRRQKIKIQ
jgi:hypothetical protein